MRHARISVASTCFKTSCMSFSLSKGSGGGTAKAFGCKRSRCAGGGADGCFGCSACGAEDGWGRGGAEARSSMLRLRFLLLLRLRGEESAPKSCLFLSSDVLPGGESPWEDLQASPRLQV